MTAPPERFTHAARDPVPRDRAAGQQRRRVLDLLRHADAPVDARHVADALDIHITTARFHLGTLENQGAVRRGANARGRGAGRPRVTYEVAPRLDYADIVSLFATHLGGNTDERETRARSIGADLARRMNLTRPQHGITAADLVSNALEELGFEIHSLMNAFGTVTVRICTCPLAEIATDAPEVIRGIQQGLIQEVLDRNSERLGRRHRVTVHPDPDHGACQVNLILHGER